MRIFFLCVLSAVLLTAQVTGKDSDWVTSDAAGVKVLIRYLEQEKRERVLLMSLDTLARLGKTAKPAVPAIVATMKRSTGSVQMAAARTLLDLDVETALALKTIHKALRSADADLRAEALLTVGEVANPTFEIASCWGPGPRPHKARPEVGKRALPALLAALRDKAPVVRASAAYSLGRVGDKVAVPALEKALADKETAVRGAAIFALGDIGPGAKAAVPALVRFLKNPKQDVALAAAESLRKVDVPALVKNGLQLLVDLVQDNRDENILVRNRAALILEHLGPGGKAAVGTFCRLLQDKDSHVRWVAARSLSIGPEAKEAVPALTAALRDPDASVRGMAAYALGSIGPEAAAAVPALVKSLADESTEVRWRGAYALGDIGPKAKAAVGTLLPMLKEEDVLHGQLAAGPAFALGRIGADAKVVVPALVATLRHKNWEARAAAASALAEFGDLALVALPALIDRLRRDDSLVLDPVAKAVTRLGPKAVETAITALIDSLKDKDKEVRLTATFSLGLVDTKGKSIPTLIRLLREDAAVRYAAARVLGDMGPKARSAVPALVEILKDEDEPARRDAAEALEKINPEAAARAAKR